MRFKLGICAKIVGLFIISSTFSSAQAEEAVKLANYTAVYDLNLDSASSKSGISNYTGRMVYEFKGDACEGYISQVRFVSRLDGVETQTMLNDYQISTFESGDGKDFRYIIKNLTNEVLDKEREGSAVQNDKELTVKMIKPTERELKFKPAQYPTFETIEMINKAEKGETFYQSVGFDGSDEDDKLSYASIFIGKQSVQEADKSDKALNKLAKLTYWPVTVTYFDDDKNPDGLPVYRTTFLLYKNGVTRDMLMDYGAFSVRAKLVDLSFYETPKNQSCEQGQSLKK